MKLFFITLFLSLAAIFSCKEGPQKFKSLTVEEFASFIADPDVQRLDVRTVAEYSEGHIAGSINLNVLDENFTLMVDSTLEKERPIALYCRSGKRSKKAAAILSAKGFHIYELDKGMQGWQAAQQPIEK